MNHKKRKKKKLKNTKKNIDKKQKQKLLVTGGIFPVAAGSDNPWNANGGGVHVK